MARKIIESGAAANRKTCGSISSNARPYGRWIDERELGDVMAHEQACDGTPAPRPN
jgi:hypothetical protein